MRSSLLSFDEATTPVRMRLLRISVSLAALALLAATWRLWIPRDHVPQVPLVDLAARLPDAIQWAALVIMTGGLAMQMVARTPRAVRATLLLFVASASLLVVADQARLQPWAYEFIVLTLVLSLATNEQALRLIRLFIASFYIYSALTKLDHAFLHTLGQQFLSALVGAVGGSIEGWSDRARLAAALVFPVGELAVGVGLLVPRARAAALVGALVLHVLLLIILGPWGLAHRPGVLLWNVYFMVQDVIVYWPARSATVVSPVSSTRPSQTAGWDRLARVVAYAAIVLPVLGPTTWFDMWPSWGLYAASAERTLLLVHRRAVDDLPTELQAFCEAGDDSMAPWLSLRIDRWVLESLDAPIYPQNRYQLGIATALVERHGLANRARIVRLNLADRWTGERASSVLASPAQMQAAGNDYFFNARPRPAPPIADP